MNKDFKHPELLKMEQPAERETSIIEYILAVVITALIAIALAVMIM